MKADDFEIYKQLREKYATCEGRRISNQLELLSVSYYAFTTNYLELQKALDAYQDPSFFKDLWNIDNRDKLFRYLDEITRLLHNFLASVKSLVDHTRIIVRKLPRSKLFLKEYERRIRKSFQESTLSNFVQHLRNYVLHKGMPLLTAVGRVTPAKASNHSIDLNLDLLRAWDGWNKYSTQYLDDMPDEVNLESVILSYKETVEDFYKWLEDTFQKVYRTELEEMKQILEEAEEFEQFNS